MNNLNLQKTTETEIDSVINFIPSAILWIDKNQIIMDTEFDEICEKNGVDLSNIINELKKVSS